MSFFFRVLEVQIHIAWFSKFTSDICISLVFRWEADPVLRIQG